MTLEQMIMEDRKKDMLWELRNVAQNYEDLFWDEDPEGNWIPGTPWEYLEEKLEVREKFRTKYNRAREILTKEEIESDLTKHSPERIWTEMEGELK